LVFHINKKTNFLSIFFSIFGILILFGCSNDLETVNALPINEILPIISIKDVSTTRTDSGNISIKAYAIEFNFFKNQDSSYSEFPKGIKVQSFSKYPKIESSITANYAIHKEKSNIWEARNNVVVTNYKGDTLITELLYWNQAKGIIFTHKLCRIRTEDGIIIGKNGFESDENFSIWKLKNANGTVNIKDE
jgi:LPS export ABC transporter protein LptC